MIFGYPILLDISHIMDYQKTDCPGRNGDLCSEKRKTQMMNLKRRTMTLKWIPGAWKPSLRQVPCDDLISFGHDPNFSSQYPNRHSQVSVLQVMMGFPKRRKPKLTRSMPGPKQWSLWVGPKWMMMLSHRPMWVRCWLVWGSGSWKWDSCKPTSKSSTKLIPAFLGC